VLSLIKLGLDLLKILLQVIQKLGLSLKQVFAIVVIIILTSCLTIYCVYHIFYLSDMQEVFDNAPQSQQDFMTREAITNAVLHEYIPTCGSYTYWSITRIYGYKTSKEYEYTAQLQNLYGHVRLPHYHFVSKEPTDIIISPNQAIKFYMSMYKKPAPINENCISKLGRLSDSEFIKLSSETIRQWDIEPLKTFVKKRNEQFAKDVWDYTIIGVIRSPWIQKINSTPKIFQRKERFPIIIVVAMSKLKGEKLKCSQDEMLGYLAEMTNNIRSGSLSGLREINSFKFIDTTEQTQRDNFLQR
jgi:hypothetical protein